MENTDDCQQGRIQFVETTETGLGFAVLCI